MGHFSAFVKRSSTFVNLNDIQSHSRNSICLLSISDFCSLSLLLPEKLYMKYLLSIKSIKIKIKMRANSMYMNMIFEKTKYSSFESE